MRIDSNVSPVWGAVAAAAALFVLLAARPLFPAVGCDLNDPDRDVKRLFPESTGYKTVYVSIDRRGGRELLRRIEERLGDPFKGLYETIDVPYTMYHVLKDGNIIGYIHGVNQKGRYGGLQVFLAVDPEGTVRGFYIQKLTSRQASLLRDAAFGRQFAGLNLGDFFAYDVRTGSAPAGSRAAGITNPASEAGDDFRAILRAVKKNLILIDEFLLGNKFLPPSAAPGGPLPSPRAD
ncbi:MAG: hypothetical protein FJY83_02430 [Candidatus Aminicenantes bacterium]|nr:hypothetical protein [Candidatus Aminicenantes bacterium]